MNNQEAFNRVWQHFVVERQPRSTWEGGGCAYRGTNGAKCAVGVLIPDDLYRPDFEARTAHVLVEEFPPIQELLNEVNVSLLAQMQGAHDSYETLIREERPFNEYMAAKLQSLAAAYDLTIPVAGGVTA